MEERWKKQWEQWNNGNNGNRWRNNGNSNRIFFFFGSKITEDGDCGHEIKRYLLLGRKTMTNRDSILKSRDKVLSSQSYGFSSSHDWMWELDSKESWAQKNWCFWTVVLEKILESPLDCKEIKPVHPKRKSVLNIHWKDWCWNTPILWPHDAKNWLTGKDTDAGKDWRQEQKGMTKEEMVRWHHWLDGHEFEQDSEVGDGQRSLMCYSSWGHNESDTTEWLNLTEENEDTDPKYGALIRSTPWWARSVLGVVLWGTDTLQYRTQSIVFFCLG